jgi:AcrR family transcriptional regulator
MARMADIRESLLDAAYDLAVTTGWQRARMVDVAAAAGVSRQTLYDQFGGRDGLARALALREAQRFLDGVERAMDAHPDDVTHAIEAAATFALTAARDNPLIRAILTENGDAGLLPYLTTRAEPLLAAAKHRLDLDEEVSEVVVRLALSYIVLPGTAETTAAQRIAHVASSIVEQRRVRQ